MTTNMDGSPNIWTPQDVVNDLFHCIKEPIPVGVPVTVTLPPDTVEAIVMLHHPKEIEKNGWQVSLVNCLGDLVKFIQIMDLVKQIIPDFNFDLFLCRKDRSKIVLKTNISFAEASFIALKFIEIGAQTETILV